MLSLAAAAFPAATVASETPPRVVVAVLPPGTSVEQLAQVEGMAPGLVSGGLGEVALAQTYLDISQGNRIDEDLYDSELPRLPIRGGRVAPRLWAETVARAEAAPADLIPGLLGSTLAEAGIPTAAERGSGLPTLIAVDRDGATRVRSSLACARGCDDGFSVITAHVDELPAISEGLRPEDMLLAFAGGPPADEQLLPAGVVAAGYGGNLTSDSTRTDGLVTSTDIAPTVLARLGVEVPEEMNGSEIESSGELDPTAVAELRTELVDRPSRDQTVLAPLFIWLLLAALFSAVFRGAAPAALTLLALSCVWAPFLLLVSVGLDADEPATALITGLGSVAMAVVTRRLAPGYAGLAVACAITVGAHAIDVIAGSPLTSLSVLGPNPGGGVRFFGIGNELEAVLTTLTLIGAGAWLSTRPALSRTSAASWFAATALVAAVAFGAGRFGADVGAAIVLAVGAATAGALALGLDWRRATMVVAGAAVLGLASLALLDLLAGGAHLSRTVLGAGEASDVANVLDRRVTLMWDTFIHPIYPELLAICVALLVIGFWRRLAVLAWFGDRWAARCGFLGAVVGVLVGTVANDSGSVLLVIGTIYLAVCAGFFWAERRGEPTHGLGGVPR